MTQEKQDEIAKLLALVLQLESEAQRAIMLQKQAEEKCEQIRGWWLLTKRMLQRSYAAGDVTQQRIADLTRRCTGQARTLREQSQELARLWRKYPGERARGSVRRIECNT